MLSILLMALQGLSPVGAEAPKLLIIDVDDYGRGLKEAHPTPIFGLLGSQARQYVNFYTAPVCSPTRAEMNYGARGTHPDLQLPWLIEPQHSPYTAPIDGPLIPLARMASNAGLTTAKVGKWHIAPNDLSSHPNDCGWQFYAGAPGNLGDFYNYAAHVNGNWLTLTDMYVTRVETQLGVALLKAGVNLVSVSYHSIHDPFHVPPAGTFTGPVPTTDVGKAIAMAQNLGTELETLIGTAQQEGYSVILFSDNGGKPPLGFGGLKGDVSDRGCRTWAYVAGPGVVPGLDLSLVGVYDVYATALEFLGVPRVSFATQGPDSVSFLNTWSGGLGTRASVFAERYTENGQVPVDIDWHTGVRTLEYKYRRRFGQDLFFDMATDPGESNNLLMGSGVGGLSPSQLIEYNFCLAEWLDWTN